MGENRRGFIGKLLGGATASAAMAFVPRAIPQTAPLPPEVKTVEQTVKPDAMRTVVLHSVHSQLRIQVAMDRAIQFRNGVAVVTEADAAMLKKHYHGYGIGKTVWRESEERAAARKVRS